MRTLCWVCGVLALSVGAAASALQQADTNQTSSALIAPASAEQHMQIHGTNVVYRAEWAEAILKDAAGVPEATVSATSYIREGQEPDAKRPVVFAFNGGPGASSSPLHFELLGPRRRTGDGHKGNAALIDNQESLLDIADLVFIDPVATGFSRELRPGGVRAYWNPNGDAGAVQMLMREWLRVHHREHSPIYVVGESYGGYRLALIAKDIGDLNVAGLVLISPMLDRSGNGGAGNDQPFIFDLPSMAVTAFYHGKSGTRDHSADQVYEDARAFAQGEYAEALQLGSALPHARRDDLASRISAYIGLPASYIASVDLRVDSQAFLDRLVPGQVVGRVDTRVLAPTPKSSIPGRPKAADDPALGMQGVNVLTSAAIGDYLRQQIGVRTTLGYVSLTLNAAFQFDWNSGSPKEEDNQYFNVTPDIAALMKQRPGTRLLLLGGYYDLATPVVSQRYALTHAAVPLDRTTILDVASGHMVYGDDHDRELTSATLRAFITKGLLPLQSSP